MRRRGLTAVLLALALLCAPAAFAAKDTDKDGLPDKWEKTKTPSGVNLKKLGATWRHRDVFVEIDFQNGISRSTVACSQLDALFTAFKNAPLSNPDKTKGVRLHLDAGKRCGSRKYDLGGSSSFGVSGPCANPSANSNGLKAKRLKIFHIASVVNDICGGAAGQAGSTDFLVDVHGGGGFAHVFMHELGHTLGLDHGGVNSFSVMSKVMSRYPSKAQAIDFNRYRVEALDESALSEVNGLQSSPAGETYLSGFYLQFFCTIGGPPVFGGPEGSANANVDFDCDGYPFWMPPADQYIDAGTVSADLNGDGVIGVIAAAPPEWPMLRFGNGRIGP